MSRDRRHGAIQFLCGTAAAKLPNIHLYPVYNLRRQNASREALLQQSRIDPLLAGSDQLLYASQRKIPPLSYGPNHPKIVFSQVAALPFRIRKGRIEVLLVTSRETKRWLIPKGWPMKGKKAAQGGGPGGDGGGRRQGQVSQMPSATTITGSAGPSISTFAGCTSIRLRFPSS